MSSLFVKKRNLFMPLTLFLSISCMSIWICSW